ncbi:FAD-binding oxidoreductase [Cryobacterium melibiosiphilum]|uniref:FAD-binding oxidoreductase n=1 Tax=Cryobacterium melibiosiphilum TaxID=995039 RepID=A0A3A5MHB2_9MICO|nr:FAD-binding oxidoreductase [Cryobacterium melibiosiphilum]RJT84781.1 FAD-binding oxidoreductase [Cryobacterium melibiosiphilum]
MNSADGFTRAVADLRQAVAGRVIVPGEAGYDEARRVWNGMIDRRPALVVQAAHADDIAAALRFARERQLPVAVRGGGHNVAGNGTVNDGLVLDLGALNRVQVLPGTRTVRVQAGATIGIIDAATEPFGLFVPSGVVSSTGIAGLTLGGGIGWMTRAHGLTVDNLLEVEMVTVHGRVVHASATENAELFWGLRGGGGNFGVVTSFTFQAHPLPPEVFSGNFVYGQEHWGDALRAYASWTHDLPDALTSIMSFLVPPHDWGLGDDPRMLFGFAWATPFLEEGARALDELRRAAPPDAEIVEPVKWTTWQSAADELFPKGVRGYWKNTSLDHLDEDVIDVLVRRGAEQTWRGTGFDVHHLGGAFGRVPESATPFPSRTAQFWLNIYGFWADAGDDAERIRFVRNFAAEMAPLGSGGLYVNFMGEERGTDAGVQDAREQAIAVYGQRKFERLSALKREYDPENVLRLNHNIPPASTVTT